MTSQNQSAQQENSLKLLTTISLVFLLIAIGNCFSAAGADIRAHLGYIKLAKFSISLAIYAVTMLWLLRQLSNGRQILSWAAGGACLGGALELASILIQALLPDWQSSALLAVGRLAILLPTFLIIVAFRLLLKENIPQALRSALLWATGLALFGCLPGALMLVQLSQQQSSSAPQLFNELKLAHFIGLHALQLMPIAYFLVSKQIANIEKQLKAINSLGLSLLALIALLTLSGTSQNIQTAATLLLTLCGVYLASNQCSKAKTHYS